MVPVFVRSFYIHIIRQAIVADCINLCVVAFIELL